MLYDTAARANEILALNIEDLDSDRKRADITGKGGHHETIVWASGTARLLPRSTPPGPTLHRPPPTNGPGSSSTTDDASGWTLRQLRHSAFTHLGEAGVSTLLLQAKSRHQDPGPWPRYAQPGIEAAARLNADHDPNRRHH